MAKGLDNHKERLELISSFGRELTRRSRSSCELCGASGVSLSVFEVPPAKEEPAAADCVFLCGECREQIANPKKIVSSHWRCLSDRIWSEIPAVKVLSIMVLRKLAEKESWAADLVEEAYLSEEENAWVEKGGF